MRARRCDELGQVTLSALKIARRAPQTVRRDFPDCFRSIASLKTSIWGNGQELPRHVPSVAEKKGRCNVRFCSHNGLKPDIGPCPFCADTVAKVENRTTPKISRKLIFRLLYRCNAL